MSPLHHLPCNSVTLLHCQFIFTAPQKIINPIASAKGQKPRRPYAPWHSPRTACSLSCLILVNKLCNPVQGRKTQPMEKLSMAGETSSNPHSYWVAGSTFRRRRSSKLSVQSCCSSRSSEATPDPPRSSWQPEPTAAHRPGAEAPVCRCSRRGDHGCFSFATFESSRGGRPTAACRPRRAFGCKGLPQVRLAARQHACSARAEDQRDSEHAEGETPPLVMQRTKTFPHRICTAKDKTVMK